MEAGDPKKQLILFVHGFPEFWYSWRYQLKEFSKDYHVIAIDQRGYNESDKPDGVSNYHIDRMVSDIRQFVKKLGKPNRCLLDKKFLSTSVFEENNFNLHVLKQVIQFCRS